jgi:hypothetical protein
MIGVQARAWIAALDAGSGAATSWNPSADQEVDALAVSGGAVYVGGAFSNIGGQSRIRLAAIDTTTGLATPWNPGADGTVRSIVPDGGLVYVGGAFTAIDGHFRNALAALDGSTAVATAWNPDPNDAVSTIAVSNGAVYAGGDFTGADNLAQAHVAAFIPATVGVGREEPSLALSASNWPNPFGQATHLRYVLPEAAVVTLRICDVAGRERAVLERGIAHGAGPHELLWRAVGLAPGMYVARLDAGRRTTSLKLVVAP